MRRIGRIEDARSARTFSDALVARGIENDVRQDDDGFDLWVHDDARLAEAREALEAFRSGDVDLAREAAVGRARRQEVARKDEAYRERLDLARRSMHGAGGHGYLTTALLLGSLAVAVVSRLGADPEAVRLLWMTEAPARALLPEVRAGQVWRLLTPALMHFGMLHLGFNLLMWWSFGRMVEWRKGLRFFAVLVITAALASNLAQFGLGYALRPAGLGLFGGLSGVLYAVFGYALTKGRFDPLDQLGVPQQTTTILLAWLVLGMTGLLGPIANGAHVGGFVWGILFAFADIAWFHRAKRRR